MSVGATPSLNFIGDTVGDVAPHSMSEMYGIRFVMGSSPVSGTISLDDFRNQILVKTMVERTKLLASDAAANDYFGIRVAISGDYAIVGASGDSDAGSASGSAYIFRRTTGTNTWDSGTKIVASDAAAGDYFGYSVAISGDYAIVGAPWKDNNGAVDSGAAYIFRRTGTNTWDSGTKINPSYAQIYEGFGRSVAISGDYVVVGAPSYNAAYIFHRTGTNTWDSGVRVYSSDLETFNSHGSSVAISGDYAIVGASYTITRGAAYIYRRTGTNTWDFGTTIRASDSATDDYFGGSVSISGDYAIVGATGNDDSGSASGSAYIFVRTGTNTWSQQAKLLASDAAAVDYFGESVSISGDYAIVGATYNDDAGNASGSAYSFVRSGTSWSQQAKIQASDAAAEDQFGVNVAIDGAYAIVGAWLEDTSATNAGAAYVFENSYYI